MLVLMLTLLAVAPASAQSAQASQVPPVDAYVWNGYDDVALPPHPCTATGVKTTELVRLDGRLFLLYTCNDRPGQERQTLRRFAPPVSEAPPPVPPATECTTVRPSPEWVCLNGGWLPATHPLANGKN